MVAGQELNLDLWLMRPEWLPNHFSAAEGEGIEPPRLAPDSLATSLSPLTYLPNRVALPTTSLQGSRRESNPRHESR